ncbi:hypothetical protein C4D60_Mb04t32700 [Musa balbisiana]|uniref:Armadillo-like repeats domain-containing protein n=1 Tax=Musa balbisiana TaxID=52838 RepID=A0A4S8KGF7_MUSBA|nr:hypothetical protein C4D60_Mb04t32700 [Musa balbisiana]
MGLSFVISFVKALRKFTSPGAQRKRLVNKNVFLLKSIDELFLKVKDEVNNSALKDLMQKTGFSMEDILRKYIRYALTEKPFNTVLVVDLIHLRKSSLLEDAQVAEILNECYPVEGCFLWQLPEIWLPGFCSRDSSLIVKEIFGVTDEDADTLRMHTLSEIDDIESMKRMVDDSVLEGHSEESPSTARSIKTRHLKFMK